MKRGRSGVTLMEMLVVVAIAAAMATIALPVFSSGLDNLRLSQASDSVAAFLNGATNRAARRQQPVEIAVAIRENAILLRSADNTFARRLEMPEGVRIEGEPRQLLLLPGATPPRFGVELSNRRGRHSLVSIDPITGVPQIERLNNP